MSPRVTYYILVLGHNQLLTLKTLSYINHITSTRFVISYNPKKENKHQLKKIKPQ